MAVQTGDRSRQVILYRSCTEACEGAVKVFETNLIYLRVIGLQASGRNIDIKNVVGHELAPVPTPLLDDSGGMRIAKSESTLKNILQVEVSDRVAGGANVSVNDGSAILWVVPWPADGSVNDYIAKFKYAIGKKLQVEDVYLIFGRYYNYITKSVTRRSRETGVSRVHHLQQEQIWCQLKSVQVELLSHGQIWQLLQEADTCNIIVQEVLSCVAGNKQNVITVVADDTDIFVLLLHYHLLANLNNVVLMESPIKGRMVVDTGQTVVKHSEIVEGILLAHTLSGCDTVASYFGIGKATVLKTLRSGYSLNLLGATGHSMKSVIQQATSFISACYGQTNCSATSETRLKVWLSKTGKRSSTPKLCTLSPTTEAFKENVKRAQHQALVWQSLKAQNPPSWIQRNMVG